MIGDSADGHSDTNLFGILGIRNFSHGLRLIVAFV
jgi:hypothetical protein